MRTRIIEAVSDAGNHGKLLIGKFDADDYGRTDVVGAPLILPRWGQSHLLVLDLETGEGALLQPGGSPHADLNKHQVWVCPLYEPFLGWLYDFLREHTFDDLPETVSLTGVPLQLSGYRRQGPDQTEEEDVG